MPDIDDFSFRLSTQTRVSLLGYKLPSPCQGISRGTRLCNENPADIGINLNCAMSHGSNNATEIIKQKYCQSMCTCLIKKFINLDQLLIKMQIHKYFGIHNSKYR